MRSCWPRARTTSRRRSRLRARPRCRSRRARGDRVAPGARCRWRAGSCFVSLGMNQIKEIDTREQLAVVEPGVILGDLHAAVEREGLFYPPDPNSLAACALGGNVAENAGGPRAFKYGVTREYVLGLEALLIGGQRIRTGRRTIKGVTGYDVTALLVGSEGTLAVFGDITLRLVPKPPAVMTLLALFNDVPQCAGAVSDIIAAGLVPRCLEFLDGTTLEAMRRAGNPINGGAGAMLLIEVDGEERECEAQAERIAGSLRTGRRARALGRAGRGATRAALGGAPRDEPRRAAAGEVQAGRGRGGAAARDRGAARPGGSSRASSSGVRTLAYGHAGDGNLHVNFLWNDPDELPRVEHAIERLFRDVLELGGTLSGEHGIGVLKAPYLQLEQSAELISLQRDLKRVFDPQGLLNPGKIFAGPSHRAC